jgi:hypothetical protein
MIVVDATSGFQVAEFTHSVVTGTKFNFLFPTQAIPSTLEPIPLCLLLVVGLILTVVLLRVGASTLLAGGLISAPISALQTEVGEGKGLEATATFLHKTRIPQISNLVAQVGFEPTVCH